MKRQLLIGAALLAAGITMAKDHPYPPGFASFVVHSNPRALFDKHIQKGDADSMLIIAEVTEGCAPIGAFKSWADYAAADPLVQSGQMPMAMQDELKAIFDRLAPECTYINARAPGRHYSKWAGEWYKKAAAAGSPAARLRLLWADPPSEDNRQSMATLLNDTVTPANFRLDYLASIFLLKYPTDDALAVPVWRYVGCTHDPECDVTAMQLELGVEYLPAQVDAILVAAKQIEYGKPTDFLVASAS